MHFPAPYQGFPMRTHITRALCAATAGVALVSLGSAGAASAADAGPVHPGTAYVVNQDSGTVTPIRTATDKAGTAINVKTYPYAIAVTPNGKTAYVLTRGTAKISPKGAVSRPGRHRGPRPSAPPRVRSPEGLPVL